MDNVAAAWSLSLSGTSTSVQSRSITRQEMLPGGLSVISARVPLSEMSDYHSRISSITGGQGSYSMELSHYEQVPANVQQQIVEAAKKAREEARAAH